MPKALDPAVGEILRNFGFGKEAVWDCHGTWVVYHRALEQIAVKAGITFDQPTIIEANGLNKSVAICATGRMADKSDWSIGEAAPANNKNGYPYAMAEKRARDRVILKLIGLHGLVYSEEEADAFKEPEAPPSRLPPKRSQAEISADKQYREKSLEDIEKDIDQIASTVALDAYIRDHLTKEVMSRLGLKQFVIEEAVATKRAELSEPVEDEPEEDTTILETLKMAAAQAKCRYDLEKWQAGQHKAIKELSPGQLAEFRAYYKKLLMGFPRSDKPYNPANSFDNWAAPS